MMEKAAYNDSNDIEQEVFDLVVIIALCCLAIYFKTSELIH